MVLVSATTEIVITAKSASPAATPAPAEAFPEPDPRRWRMLPVILSAIFMAMFDYFVVNVAAPSFQQDLHTTDAGLELVVGGYGFAYAAGLITGGRLGGPPGHQGVCVFRAGPCSPPPPACGICPSSAPPFAVRA